MRFTIPAVELAFALLAFSVAAPAQNQQSSVPRTPDLLGLYPGMPMMAARAQLQQHSKSFPVLSHTDPDDGFGMTISSPGWELINVYLTRAPNDSAVWMIQRTQNFAASEPMSIKALLGALHEKYGKETLTMDRGGGGLYLFWIFDPSGKLRASADQDLTACSGGNFINYVVNGPPPTQTGAEPACFRSFFAITAMLNRHDSQMLQAYTVELVNLPYALNAATNTLRAKNAAADKAREELVRKADQKKPSF